MSNLVFSVSPSATSITEGASITFTVNLSSPFSAVERVNYALTFSSASGSDFVGTQSYSGTLSFDPDQTVKTISFTTLDDSLKELSEQFTFSLINVEEWTEISQTAGSSIITLVDNDTPPLTTFNNTFGSYIGTTGADNVSVISFFNSIVTGKGDDIINLATSVSNIDAGDGNDEITSVRSTTSTNIDGGAGNDSITISGVVMNVFGGSGDDIIRLVNTSAVTINGGNGIDTIDLSQFDNWGEGVGINLATNGFTAFGFSNISNLENVIGTNFADSIVGSSTSNLLNGGGGNDTIDSGLGSDTVSGGEGNDQLDGQSGTDTLIGGTGNDVFKFSSAKDLSKALAKADTISDFTRGEDQIYLNFDSNTKVKGIQTSFNFIGNQAFTKTAGQVRFTPTLIDSDGSNYIFLQGDTNGDGSFDFVIKLSGITTLSKSDFFAGTIT